MRRALRDFGAMVIVALMATGAGAEGLPSGVADVALTPEPALPAPAGWPFGESFPRTFGTGRHDAGAFFWTDFLYDDTGAVGTPDDNVQNTGTYTYPLPDQALNGADIFRVAIGRDATDTWWRVDWNTLIDASVPIAAFAIDSDANPVTGAALWPAGAGLVSPGLERALVISGTGAWLVDTTAVLPAVTPVAALGGALFVDMDARSFVVRLPHAALDATGVATVRVAAGLANATGDGFLELTSDHNHLPGQPNVYNVSFRQIQVDEASGTFNDSNLWFDREQATALTAGGNVADFAVDLDWGRLTAGDSEPEPLVTGYINMWHSSSFPLGQGVENRGPGFGGLVEFGYLGRVQPFAVYVPTGYDPAVPAPLTWNLHGAFSFHNSTLGRSPALVQGMCEDRGSICVAPLGRGQSHGWDNEAEIDFWEVWRAAASQFNLDPERTILTGISMGGFGTYRIGLANPEPFAAFGVMLGHAQSDFAAIGNARWHPIYHVHGDVDELVPIASTRATVAELDRREYRYRFDEYATETHTGFSQKDSWPGLIEWLAEQGARTLDPGRVTFVWYTADRHELEGYGPTGAWWVQDVRARDPGLATAGVDAHSLANPDPAIDEVVRTITPMPDAQPSPATRMELAWQVGAAPTPEKRLTLDLDNVGTLTLDLARAGLVPPGAALGDWDGDTIADASDNCPATPNPDQSDTAGLGSAGPDGTGDACQCGDVSDNGAANGQDANAIRRHALGIDPNPLFRNLCKCDVTGNGLCNGQDGNALAAAALGLPSLFDPTACPAFTGERRVEVDSDGPSEVVLTRLVPGSLVSLDGVPEGAVGDDGRLSVSVPAGTHWIAIRR